MSEFEHDIYKSVVHNASLFLKEGIKILFCDNDFHKASIDADSFILAVSHIQMAMELAAKSYIIYYKGLKSVVHSSQANLPIEDLQKLYYDHRLKVQEFDAVVKQLNGSEFNLRLSKSKRKRIKEFQNYRNKLFHLTCNIEEHELENMRDTLLMYSINTVMFLLFDQYQNERPSDFMAQLTNWDYFHTLQHSKIYRDCMKEIAKESGDTILVCPLCENLAYSKEEEYCYVCSFDGIHFGRTDCEECGGVKTVIFDRGAHFNGHPNLYQGFCQECETKNAIFECPRCGKAYHYYFQIGKQQCEEGHCIYND